jgi:peroxiredoxin
MSEEAWDIVERATEELRRSTIAEGAVGVGDTAPDFTLPNAAGTDVALRDLLDDGPVVLSFFRGGWCPYCSLELRALQESLADIEGAGARLVAVAPQTPKDAFQTKRKNDLDFEVLSDAGHEVARTYGLVFELPDALKDVYRDEFGVDLTEKNADGSWNLPIPATYVVDDEQTVCYAFAEADYTHRADPSQIVDTLQDLYRSG